MPIEAFNDDDLDIVQESIAMLRYGDVSIDEVAYMFGVDSVCLYENINIIESINLIH